jgi:hypothetical protein
MSKVFEAPEPTPAVRDDEVARLDALVEKVSELVGALAAIVRDIRNTPHNGPDRAQLVRILAKLPAAG